MTGIVLTAISFKAPKSHFEIGSQHSNPLLVFLAAGSISEHSCLLSGTAFVLECGAPKQTMHMPKSLA